MAHPTGTTARVQRLTALVAIVLVAVAVGFAFGRVFVGHHATYKLLAVGVASAIVAWLFERRSLLLATIVSAALLIVAIGILVFPSTTWFGAPTLETLRQMGHAAAQVGEEARIQISPAPANDSLMLAAITAVWAAVFSCFALAFRAGSPLLALVPPVALVAFADSVLEDLIKPFYGVLFLVAALAVVFADSIRRIHGWGPVWSPPGARNRLLPSAGRGARRIGAGAVVLAALAPIFVPGFGSKAVIDLSQVNSDNRVHVSPLVTIGALLNQSEPVEIVQVQANRPAYWRMVGLDQLDPNGGWNATPEQGKTAEPGVPLSQGASGTSGTEVDATFTVENDLAFTTLPIPYQPSELVSADESVSWFAGSQSMSVAEWPDADSTYAVKSFYPTPSARELRAGGASRTEYAADTRLPDVPEIDQIMQLAQDWTKGASSDFDKVIAIQDHLRTFPYDQTAQYADSFQGLLSFLQDPAPVGQHGFCEQFASAMAVMLRTLHIPARVATGFTAGAPMGNGTYRVTTEELHAWVEVPFSGYGWLPFEPTPGQNTVNPATSTYINSSSASCSGPNCNVGPSPGDNGKKHHQRDPAAAACRENPRGFCKDTGLNDNDRVTQTGTTGRNGRAGAPPPDTSRMTLTMLVLWTSVIAALILAAIPLARWLRRRRALAHAREPRELILATYDVFSERAADLGLGRGRGETPSEYRRRIEATDLLTDGHMERLTGTVVRAAYSTRPVSQDDALDATADADHVIRDLRRSTSLRRRIVGIYRRD
jgi:transglutaminase-like putative cysteine protease